MKLIIFHSLYFVILIGNYVGKYTIENFCQNLYDYINA